MFQVYHYLRETSLLWGLVGIDINWEIAKNLGSEFSEKFGEKVEIPGKMKFRDMMHLRRKNIVWVLAGNRR